jgi:predicted metal-dependent hydrolase
VTASLQVRERVSARARRVRVDVRPNGEVVVTIPRRGSRTEALRFLHQSREWIERTRSRLAAQASEPALPPRERAALRAQAAAQAGVLLDEEAARLGVRYAGLRIRDPRSRWGSCGPDGHIMLSLRLAMAPLEVFRYVAVHELCHLRWRGHGKRFWEMVGRQLPDFREHRAWLRRNGNTLQRVPLVG